MADDDNKPVNGSNKPVNGGEPNVISKIQTERVDAVGGWTERQEELEKSIRDENAKFQAMENEYNNSSNEKRKAKLNAQMHVQSQKHTQAEEMFADYEQTYARTKNIAAAKEITTYTKYDNVNSRTTTMSGSQRYYSQIQQDKRAGGNLLRIPTEVVESRIKSGQQEINKLGSSIAGSTMGLGVKDTWSEDAQGKSARISELQEDVSLNKRLLKVQTKEGMTTEKRQYSTRDTLSRASSFLDQDKLNKDIAGGEYGDLDTETSKLTGLFGKLSAAAEKFEKASENATDAQGNLTEEYIKSSDNLDDLQKQTAKQSKVVEGTKRLGEAPKPDISQRVTSGLIGFNRATHENLSIGIEDEMSEMRLKSAMGNRAIQQYNRRDAAIGGDMSALLREVVGQQFASDFSDKMGKRAGWRAGATMSAGAEKGLGDIVKGVFGGKGGGKGVKKVVEKGAKQLFKKIAGGALAMGGDAAVAASSTFRKGVQMARGIPQTMAKVEAGLTTDQILQTLLTIPAQNSQAFYDNYMTQSKATMGLGAGALGAQYTATHSSNISTLGDLGISPARSAQLAQQGVQQIGSTQDMSTMLQFAGKMEQSRLMSADQYMGMQGQASNSGAGTFDLEDALKMGIAAGFDNSKNLQQMVDATTSMAMDVAKSGSSSGFMGAANLLGVSTQRLESMGVSKNTSTLVARSAMDAQDKDSRDTSMSVSSVYEIGRLEEVFPDASETQIQQLAGLVQNQYSALIKGGKPAAEKIGLGSLWDKDGKKKFKKGAGIDLGAAILKRNIGSQEAEEMFKDIRYMEEGEVEKISETSASRFATTSGGSSIYGISRAGDEAKKAKLPNKVAGKLEEQRKMENAAINQKIIAGQGKGSADDKMSQMMVIMQKWLDNLNPADAQANVERSMRDQDEVPTIVKAGEEFTGGTKVFLKAVREFDVVLKRIDLSKQKTNVPTPKLQKQDGSDQSKLQGEKK